MTTMTDTITTSLFGRARERSTSEFGDTSMAATGADAVFVANQAPALPAAACVGVVSPSTKTPYAAATTATNPWLAGVGVGGDMGFGSISTIHGSKLSTKRIHPGRLEGMT